MLDSTVVQNLPLKQVGADREKIKERVSDLWAKSTSDEKKAAFELSGASRITFNRTCRDGSLNLRVAVSLAQIFKVNPKYITGEVDARGTCSAKNLNAFLAEHGVDVGQAEATDSPVNAESAEVAERSIVEPSVAKQPVTKKRATRKTVAEQTANEVSVPIKEKPVKEAPAVSTDECCCSCSEEPAFDEFDEEEPLSPETQKFIDGMTEEDMVVLLKSALLRAKTGVPEFVAIADAIKRILLSIY